MAKELLEEFICLPLHERISFMNMFMQELSMSETQQLRLLLPSEDMDIISLLPIELAVNVLSFLRGIDLISCLSVSAYWRSLVRSFSELWRNVVLSQFRCCSCCVESALSNFMLTEMQEVNHNSRSEVSVAAALMNPPWCRFYSFLMTAIGVTADRRLTEWQKNGLLVPTSALTSTSSWKEVLCGLVSSAQPLVDGSMFVAANSGDSIITKRINWFKSEIVHETASHWHAISSAWFGDSFMVTGGFDFTLEVWERGCTTPSQNLLSHTAAVRCIDVNAATNRVVSGSADNSVRQWNLITGELLLTLHGGHQDLSFVAYYDDSHSHVSFIKILSVCNYQLNIWTSDVGMCLYTLNFVDSIYFRSFCFERHTAAYVLNSHSTSALASSTCMVQLLELPSAEFRGDLKPRPFCDWNTKSVSCVRLRQPFVMLALTKSRAGAPDILLCDWKGQRLRLIALPQSFRPKMDRFRYFEIGYGFDVHIFGARYAYLLRALDFCR